VGISVLCGVTGIDWLPPEAAAATAAPAASTAAAAAVEEVNGMIPEKNRFGIEDIFCDLCDSEIDSQSRGKMSQLSSI
jgi:hypothetical protein